MHVSDTPEIHGNELIHPKPHQCSEGHNYIKVGTYQISNKVGD